jgi:hypothetical protein
VTPQEYQDYAIAEFLRGQSPSAVARLFNPNAQVEHWGGAGGAGSVRNAVGGSMTLGAAAAPPNPAVAAQYRNLSGLGGEQGLYNYGSMQQFIESGALKHYAGGLEGLDTNTTGITGAAHPATSGQSVSSTGKVYTPQEGEVKSMAEILAEDKAKQEAEAKARIVQKATSQLGEGD